ncbi:TetR/AcrR family transcriptional regulator [Streptomyces sp. NBC_01410]|uniref:TetR/AcrR family transcriptional regulator n=1 Tax=Streptomyces sp. NBC_01410 TaxID=2903856 RepID=UPI0032441BFA
MSEVPRRAGVGKSTLYRRWPSKQDMVIAVLSEFSVPPADVPEGLSLREDLQSALQRAVERGELPTDLDLKLALDLLAAPVYWRLSVRHAQLEPDYFDRLVEHLLRALDARPAPQSQAHHSSVT